MDRTHPGRPVVLSKLTAELSDDVKDEIKSLPAGTQADLRSTRGEITTLIRNTQLETGEVVARAQHTLQQAGVPEGVAQSIAAGVGVQAEAHNVKHPSVVPSKAARRKAAARLYAHPIVRPALKPSIRKDGNRPRKPSYIPGELFVAAVLQDAGNGDPANALYADVVANLPVPLRSVAQGYAAEIGGDLSRLRARLETWYDQQMDRVSGWYKRRVQYVLAVLGLLLAIAINADALDIADRLWNDAQLRGAVVTQAEQASQAHQSATSKQNANSTATTTTSKIPDLSSISLPLGWTLNKGSQAVPAHDDWKGWAAKILGILITALALTLGAPFWFDLLANFVNVRGGGAKPDASAGTAKTSSGLPQHMEEGEGTSSDRPTRLCGKVIALAVTMPDPRTTDAAGRRS